MTDADVAPGRLPSPRHRQRGHRVDRWARSSITASRSPGRHWVMNSLAVLGAVQRAGRRCRRRRRGLGAIEPLDGRGRRHRIAVARRRRRADRRKLQRQPGLDARRLRGAGREPAGPGRPPHRRAGRHAGARRRQRAALHAALAEPLAEAQDRSRLHRRRRRWRRSTRALPKAMRGGHDADRRRDGRARRPSGCAPATSSRSRARYGSRMAQIVTRLRRRAARLRGQGLSACCYDILPRFADRFTPFNLFRYLTFRSGGAVVTALFISFWLRAADHRLAASRSRAKASRSAPTGRQSHLVAKKGTPTMGGFLILLALTSRPCCGPISPTAMSGSCCS